MGKKVQRLGDADSAGGIITEGDNTVFVDGKPIAVQGKSVSPHAPFPPSNSSPPHQCAKTVGATSSIKVNGKNIVVAGDSDTCGHKRIGGSNSVTVG